MNFELLERGPVLESAVIVGWWELFQSVLEPLRRFLEPLLLVQRVAVVEEFAHEYETRARQAR